jgi:hypothetical protein
MTMAEDLANEKRCLGIWLDTFDFQAPEFYKKLGFSQFGEIVDYPPGHSRHYFQKRLKVESRALREQARSHNGMHFKSAGLQPLSAISKTGRQPRQSPLGDKIILLHVVIEHRPRRIAGHVDKRFRRTVYTVEPPFLPGCRYAPASTPNTASSCQANCTHWATTFSGLSEVRTL